MGFKFLPYVNQKNLLIGTVLFLIAFLGFFQFTFNLNPVKYDMIDCYFPWRFYIGECLQNHQLPLWNPYQDYGYPIHADPSSGAWYPFVWLIGFFHGYSVYALGFEFCLHVFFAGCGFYLLAGNFQFDRKTALILAVSYMLCGLFVGNAQHLSYIISAAWIPFILNFYFKLIRNNKTSDAVKMALFSFLLITGGYPAFTIILVYLLACIFLVESVRKIRSKAYRELWNFTLKNALVGILTLLLSSVFITSLYQVSPFLSRLGDFNLDQANFSPFSPQSFISFILPYSTTVHQDFFDTDLSMRNAYFGIILFVFFLLGLFVRKDKNLKILFYFGLFCLLASVGSYLPVRSFLYDHFPLMNVFRFPSVFRLFAIIPFILIAGMSLKTYLKPEVDRGKLNKLLLVSGSFILLFCAGVLISRFNSYLELKDLVLNHLFTDSNETSFIRHVAFQSLIQILVLSLCCLIFLKWKNSVYKFQFVFALILLDLFASMQFNASCTVYYDHVTASETQGNIARIPTKFTVPKSLTFNQVDSLGGFGQPYWKNLAIFQQQFSADGFNSFTFSELENLENKTPYLNLQIKRKQLYFLSDEVYPDRKIEAFEAAKSYPDSALFFGEEAYSNLKKESFSSHKTDFVKFSSYSANHFEFESRTENRQVFTLFQKYYTGWKVYLNGKETRIELSDRNFMSVILPKGKTRIRFTYENKPLNSAFVLSLTTLFLCLIYLSVVKWSGFIRRKNQ